MKPELGIGCDKPLFRQVWPCLGLLRTSSHTLFIRQLLDQTPAGRNGEFYLRMEYTYHSHKIWRGEEHSKIKRFT